MIFQGKNLGFSRSGPNWFTTHAVLVTSGISVIGYDVNQIGLKGGASLRRDNVAMKA